MQQLVCTERLKLPRKKPWGKLLTDKRLHGRSCYAWPFTKYRTVLTAWSGFTLNVVLYMLYVCGEELIITGHKLTVLISYTIAWIICFLIPKRIQYNGAIPTVRLFANEQSARALKGRLPSRNKRTWSLDIGMRSLDIAPCENDSGAPYFMEYHLTVSRPIKNENHPLKGNKPYEGTKH